MELFALNIRNSQSVHSFKQHYKFILIYFYYSLEFIFVCTCFFSYQHPDIICVNINFQVVSS